MGFFLILLIASLRFPPPLSPTIDINAFAKVSEKGVVTFLRGCKGFDGASMPLSVAVAKIRAKPPEIFRIITSFESFPKMFHNISKVKVIERRKNRIKVEFKISVNFFFVKPSISYVEIFDVSRKPFRLVGWVVKGPNRGGWRQWEIIPLNKNESLVIFSLCEDVTRIPLASAIFKVNPHIKVGFPIASVWVVLDKVKKIAEGRT